MPYHHESLRLPVDEADALIARVQRSIADCTAQALQKLVIDLSPSYAVVALALRALQFAELPETVAAVRQSYTLQCAADGMMYQLALCGAARDLGLEVDLCRRGQETARAASRLAIHPDAVESFICDEGRPAGPPWTEEHRRAFAAGIAALAARVPHRITIQAR
jgi:hypothetical protein